MLRSDRAASQSPHFIQLFPLLGQLIILSCSVTDCSHRFSPADFSAGVLYSTHHVVMTTECKMTGDLPCVDILKDYFARCMIENILGGGNCFSFPLWLP